MAGREVLRDREELQQLVAKAGPHAQSPYKADFQGLAAAGGCCAVPGTGGSTRPALGGEGGMLCAMLPMCWC
jgi:hypothetical protein